MQTYDLTRLRKKNAPLGRAPALRTRSRYLLIRRSLLDRLADARHRYVVLRAPAGFGKSSLLASWRGELVPAGVDVAWLDLAERHADVSGFLADLVASLALTDLPIAREPARLAGLEPDDESIERVIIALVRGIAAHSGEVVLVIDDAHLARDPGVQLAIQLLVDYAPTNLRCVFATRQPLPISLARAQAARTVLDLGIEDLRFSRIETLEYLAAMGSGVDPRLAQGVHRQTEGWAALLNLASADLRRRRGVFPPPVDGMADPAPFADFFETEVLSRFSEGELHVLVCCAVPAMFDETLCAGLVGVPAALSGCKGLFDRLAGEGLLGAQSAALPGERWWLMHPLLRSTLAAHARAWPEHDRRQIHATLWQFFADRGIHHEAVRHALLAGDEGAAAELADRGAMVLFAKGDVRPLIALLRQLPQTLLRANVALRLWAAWIELCEYRLEDCAASIGRLQVELVDAEPAIRFRLTLLRCLLAIRLDDSDTVKAMQSELLQPPAEADAIALAGRRNILTWLFIHVGEFERARRIQSEEPAPTLDGEPIVGSIFGSLAGRCLVGLSHVVQGHMRLGEQVYREVLREAEERGAQCAEAARLAALLLVEVLYEQEGPEAAIRFIEEHGGANDTLMPDTTLRIMAALNRAHQAAGRTEEALACIARMRTLAQRFRIDRMQALALIDQLKIQLARGDVEFARGSMEAIGALAGRHTGAQGGAPRRIRRLAEEARVRMAMHEGDLHVALAKIEGLVAESAQSGELRHVVYFSLQAAEVERRLGRAEQCRTRVRSALRLGHALGLKQTILWSHDGALALIREACAEPDVDPLLSFYVERIEALARAQVTGIQGALPETGRARGARWADLLTPREGEVAELLAQSMPNKKIAHALGLSLDTVKWHLRNIYMKLDAPGRDAVVRKVRAEATCTSPRF